MLYQCTIASSDEEKEDDVDTRKRYYFRQRKAVERYQAPLESRLYAASLKSEFLDISVIGFCFDENIYALNFYLNLLSLFCK